MIDKKYWRKQMLVIMRDSNWALDAAKVAKVQYLAKLIQRPHIPERSIESLALHEYENWLASGSNKSLIAKQHGVSLATLGRYVHRLRQLAGD